MFERTIAFAAGLAADARFGDPPNALHPVVLIGRAAALARRHAPEDAAARRRYGLAMALAIPAGAGLLAHTASRCWPAALGGRVAGEAALLALASSRRSLLARATEVADALDRDDLEEARRLLGYHLVSRDTGDLSAEEVAGAAIESVAENLHDGMIGPWFAFAKAGSAGAWAYRATNTLDSLWGYHDPFLEELGMGAARLDDLFNLIPARLGAGAIAAAATLLDADASGALRAWRADARRTPSPNAGAPMAAMAGALGLALGKRGTYLLNEGGRAPASDDIRRAVRIVNVATALVAALLAGTLIGRAR